MTVAGNQRFWPLQWRALGLYSASALYGFTNGALFPLIAIALAEAGVDQISIGWIASAYYAGAFLAALTFAPVVRLIGYRWSMLLIAVIGSASAAAAVLPLPFLGWIGIRLAFGYAASGVYIVIDSWLGNLSGVSNRGRMLGINEGLRTALASAGQLLVAFAQGGLGILIAAGSMLLAGVPVLTTPEPVIPRERREQQSSGLVIALRNVPVVAMVALSGLTISVIYAMSALFAREAGLSPAETAAFLLVTIVSGAISQNLLGVLTDLFGRAIVISAAAAIGFVAAGLLVLGTFESFLAITIAGSVVTAAAFPVYALSLARLIDLVRPAEVVSATGIAVVSFTSGAIFGPVLAGYAMSLTGAAGFYGYLAVGLWLVSAISLGEAFRRR